MSAAAVPEPARPGRARPAARRAAGPDRQRRVAPFGVALAQPQGSRGAAPRDACPLPARSLACRPARCLRCARDRPGCGAWRASPRRRQLRARRARAAAAWRRSSARSASPPTGCSAPRPSGRSSAGSARMASWPTGSPAPSTRRALGLRRGTRAQASWERRTRVEAIAPSAGRAEAACQRFSARSACPPTAPSAPRPSARSSAGSARTASWPTASPAPPRDAPWASAPAACSSAAAVAPRAPAATAPPRVVQRRHRGRQPDRLLALQVRRRPRLVPRLGLRLLGIGLLRAARRRPAEDPARLRRPHELRTSGARQAHHDLRELRPRLHDRERPPLRHQRAAHQRFALDLPTALIRRLRGPSPSRAVRAPGAGPRSRSRRLHAKNRWVGVGAEAPYIAATWAPLCIELHQRSTKGPNISPPGETVCWDLRRRKAAPWR